MESLSNGKEVQKICIFSWNFYIKIKEKISLWPDGNQGVSKECQLRVTVFHWSSTMQFTVLSLSALPHNMLRVFTMCSVCSMCSDIPKDSGRSTCKLTWLITVSILRLCGLPEHDNRALVVLLETLPHCHGNHILFLQHVYQNAEPPLFCASQRMLNGILWDPTITDEDATALLHHCRRLY